MRLTLLLCSMLVASCAAPTRNEIPVKQDLKVRISYGYGKPVHFGDYLNTSGGSGRPVDLSYFEASAGKEILSSDLGSVDLFAGGFSTLPVDHEASSTFGIIVSPRYRYPLKPGVDSFVAPQLGLAWGDWNEQGGDFNFMLGTQVGMLIEVDVVHSVSIFTSTFHISNAGMKKANPGYNSDVFGIAFERKF